ncbi:MAG: hypothetical protein OJF52_000766 [Nitrospira sp.]|nr:MAG: hypothetical protein OJF52_000766 [Nitrospira sp.]
MVNASGLSRRRPALALCGLWALLLFAPAPAEAAESGTAGSKDAAAAEEPSPEQAAGGREGLRRLRKACEADVKRFCTGVRMGGGRILKCLREHETDLATGCRQAVGTAPAKP